MRWPLRATWVGWKLAVNLALQLEERWLKAIAVPAELTIYISGVAAGAAGAGSTSGWRNSIRPPAAADAACGRGLLLPSTNHYDNAFVLLLPWQTTIAALLGFGIGPRLTLDR